MFLGLSNTDRLVGILSDVVNHIWRPLTGSTYQITYVSARTHNSNEISTATPTFSRSSNSVELVPIVLPDVNGSRKSEMAGVKPENLFQVQNIAE